MFQKITFKSYLYNTYSNNLNNPHFVDKVKANVIFNILLDKDLIFFDLKISV